MRKLCAIALPLLLAGCLLPTPVSVVTTSFDVLSYAVSGKTVADHGLSLAMGEDCAVIRVLEGEICAEQRDYGDAVLVAVLEPLPDSLYSAQLAGAAPEVLAAVQRANRHDGVDGGQAPVATQFAALGVDYLADDAQPTGHDFELIADDSQLAAAEPPLPGRRPMAAEAVPSIQLAAIPARPAAEAAPILEPAAGPQGTRDAAPRLQTPVMEFVAQAPEAVRPPVSPRALARAFQAELAAPSPADVAAPAEDSRAATLDPQLAALFWDSGNSEVGDRPEVPVIRAPQRPRHDAHLTVAERLSRADWKETGS